MIKYHYLRVCKFSDNIDGTGKSLSRRQFVFFIHEGWCFIIANQVAYNSPEGDEKEKKGEKERFGVQFKYAVKQFFKRADIFLLVMSLICAGYGLTLVARATAYTGSNKFLIVQSFSLFLGLIAFVVFTLLDADILGEQWKWLCVINVLLLVALIIFGQDDGTGNKSWIRFAGIGIQPSEVIKVLYIVISAKQMTYLKEYRDINSFMSVVQMAGHFAIVFGMVVVVSSDLGSASILLGIFLVMFFALGVRLYWFALGGAAVAALVPVIWSYLLKPYQRNRLLAPYDKTIDPDGWGITWQTTQSKLSLAYGRLTGVTDDYTPNIFTGKHTDFIFATAGEQFGMIGALILIAMLIIIMIHCVRVGLRSGRTYDMLICVGVAASLAFQTFINIGMCLGITPVIGITLPFFSYGGSSMLTTFAAMGLVSGVKYKPKPQLFSMMY